MSQKISKRSLRPSPKPSVDKLRSTLYTITWVLAAIFFIIAMAKNWPFGEEQQVAEPTPTPQPTSVLGTQIPQDEMAINALVAYMPLVIVLFIIPAFLFPIIRAFTHTHEIHTRTKKTTKRKTKKSKPKSRRRAAKR